MRVRAVHLSLSWCLLSLASGCEPSDKESPVVDVGGLEDGSLVDSDGDGFLGDEDCNDGDASVSPAAVEVCDGLDNDCDGIVDEDVLQTFYADADGDGFGDAGVPREACAQPEDSVPNANDCDDTDGGVFPGATEVCNGIDDNCSGVVDDGLGGTFYPDADGDGFGDTSGATTGCDPGDGWVEVDGDCDDAEADAFPGNPEVCDEVDNNCDGTVDEGQLSTFYIDLDADGWGDAASVTEGCTEPAGYSSFAGDCDDGDASVSPDASEVCNEVDDDCDGSIDEAGATGGAAWYTDGDGDGYGDPGSSTVSCAAPSGTVGNDADCDDTDPSISPAATEVCNEVDDDCDGDVDDADASVVGAATWYPDLDADGFGDPDAGLAACEAPSSYTSDDQDCDDADPAVSPDGLEICNGLDDDCDGDVDDDDPDVSGGTAWYADADADGYGGSALGSACLAPSGAASVGGDCDDGDAGVSPAATETCDGVDEDCDGVVDDGVLGTGAACPADDCAEILADNPAAADGSYELVPGTYTCDMTTDGGGWTRVAASAYVYGTGHTGIAYNSEGFTWSQALFTYASGSVHAHCSYPSSLTSCNNIGMQFASEDWGVALNWGSSLCGMATTSYTSATTYIGGYDWIIDRAVSTDTVRVGTLEGIAGCTTSDNPGGAYLDIWVRD